MQTVVRAAAGDQLTLAPNPAGMPVYMDDTPAPPPPKPLAGELDKLGIKTGPFAVYGFVEGSYTASFANAPNNILTGRVFEFDDNESMLLNQADLTIEKTVDASAAAKAGKIDVGGRVETIYGSDARYIHSNGMNFYGSAAPQLSPENQFDVVQAYADVALPVGTGLTIRAGKFVTLLGYETINPTTNSLYSHSYMFGYAIPFTNTGVLGMYNINDKLSVTGGITRGWDQSLKDNNGQVDYTGQVKYVFNEKLTGYMNAITGPEEATGNAWRTVFDWIAVYTASEHLSLAGNVDLGIEPFGGPTGQSAQWYGTALYGGYKINDYFTPNIRGEWFADPQGARGLGGNLYEVTFGVTIHPMPASTIGSNLVVRPELRYDYSDEGIFDGGTQNDQWTVAVDAFFTF
jgi:hypothetical protein